MSNQLKRKSFIVTMDLPTETTIPEAQRFIKVAVQSEHGHYPPNDPRFNLGRNITVEPIKDDFND